MLHFQAQINSSGLWIGVTLWSGGGSGKLNNKLFAMDHKTKAQELPIQIFRFYI